MLNKLILFCYICVVYYSALCVSQCYEISSGPECTFNSGCYCSTSNGNTNVSCYSGSGVFPAFPYYQSGPIVSVYVEDEASVIYDNAFYLLMNLTNAAVCIVGFNSPRDLTTYENTFLTFNTNGITSLTFDQVNPINISTMSNSQSITNLVIQSNGQLLTSVPNLKSFISLRTLSLYGNGLLTLQPNDLDTLFGTLTAIDASYNKITTIDSGFSKWLSLSVANTLNLNGNPPFQCDSELQWMATYVICPPQQILIADTATCQTGEPLFDYLVPYAKCAH